MQHRRIIFSFLGLIFLVGTTPLWAQTPSNCWTLNLPWMVNQAEDNKRAYNLDDAIRILWRGKATEDKKFPLSICLDDLQVSLAQDFNQVVQANASTSLPDHDRVTRYEISPKLTELLLKTIVERSQGYLTFRARTAFQAWASPNDLATVTYDEHDVKLKASWDESHPDVLHLNGTLLTWDNADAVMTPPQTSLEGNLTIAADGKIRIDSLALKVLGSPEPPDRAFQELTLPMLPYQPVKNTEAILDLFQPFALKSLQLYSAEHSALDCLAQRGMPVFQDSLRSTVCLWYETNCLTSWKPYDDDTTNNNTYALCY